MPRYKNGVRTLVPWLRYPELRVAKQLAGAILNHEAVNKWSLWDRLHAFYPDVSEKVLGQRLSFADVRHRVEEETGKRITPNKLWGRADVVIRDGYREVDHYTAVVTDSYFAVSGVVFELDPIRCFTDEQVRLAIISQRKKCGNPACKAPFSSMNPPVGDHRVAHCRGGRTIQSNCVALCTTCNNRKGSLPYDEFLVKCGMVNRNGRKKLGKELEEQTDGHEIRV